MSERVPVIVLGGSGYVAGEMLRLVAAHPRLALAAAVSTSRAGEPLAAAFAHLEPAYPEHRFVSLEQAVERLDEAPRWVALSAAPHGASAQIVDGLLDAAASAGVTLSVVDASADFRFADADAFASVYGHAHAAPSRLAEFTCAVPEQHADLTTPHAAHPGCFATSMLLGIVPLSLAGLTDDRYRISAVTGSTGAGRSPRDTTHHPVRQSNLFAYQALAHRHAPEVAALALAASGRAVGVDFVPHSGPFARGIHATIFAGAADGVGEADVRGALAAYYADSAFVRVLDAPPRMKDVAGSNYAALYATVAHGTIVVCSVLDNLVKGAAGGSLQWVNRLLGLPDATGLTQPAAGWI